MSAGCGPNNREQTEAIATTLAEKYGGRVKVQYIDLFSPEGARYQDAWGVIRTHNLTLPVVAVNDRVRMHGGLPLKELEREIESVLGHGGA